MTPHPKDPLGESGHRQVDRGVHKVLESTDGDVSRMPLGHSRPAHQPGALGSLLEAGMPEPSSGG